MGDFLSMIAGLIIIALIAAAVVKDPGVQEAAKGYSAELLVEVEGFTQEVKARADSLKKRGLK